ncbi:hypothetical protein ACFVTY_03430 [Streptomyces sp. NPDC058067]|uniref:hypothetical protein n=1 Tax=Streptomyces sp. NPDC058067 TaxID=3346324 RepID=UPI0036E87096
MPKPHPEEFREDVVRVARNRGPGATLEWVAAGFGVPVITLSKWMRRAPQAMCAVGHFTQRHPAFAYGGAQYTTDAVARDEARPAEPRPQREDKPQGASAWGAARP